MILRILLLCLFSIATVGCSEKAETVVPDTSKLQPTGDEPSGPEPTLKDDGP